MKDILVSVIFPSRGRGYKLLSTLDSIIEKTKNLERIEILIKIDDDDNETLKILKTYKNFNLLNIIISDRKNGYASLNEYYNELYDKSNGKFIFCANDDILLLTDEWDGLVSQYENDFVCLHHNPTFPHNDVWYFPIISKKILDIIGCVSKSVFYDGYLFFMLEDLGIFRRIDLTIQHESIDDDLTVDKNKILQGFREGTWEFDTKRDLMIEDRNKIINYLNNEKK
jgi:hypothetical protein